MKLTDADLDRLEKNGVGGLTSIEEQRALIEQAREALRFKRDTGLEPFWWAYNAIELDVSLDKPGYGEMHYRLRCAIEELEKLLSLQVPEIKCWGCGELFKLGERPYRTIDSGGQSVTLHFHRECWDAAPGEQRVDKLKRFIVRWYVPALAQWIDVATGRSLDQAQELETHFRKSMREVWTGELRVAIVRINEEVVSDG